MVVEAQNQDRTMVDALAGYAAATPASAAYVDELGIITYAELWGSVHRRAAWLAAQGLRAGDTAALVFETEAAYARRDLELLYAAAHLGAVVLPVFPDVPQAACMAMVERFAARWLIARGVPPRVGAAFGIDPERNEAPQHVEAVRGDKPQAGAIYLFTSGTTGMPKALLFTHAQLHANVRASSLAIGADASDRQMAPIPWPSAVGMRYMHRAHAVGAAYVSVVLPETRTELGKLLERFGVTRVNASPWQARRLLQSPPPPHPLPPLRSFITIGAFFSVAEVEAARAALTPNVMVSYGLNEMGAVSLVLPGAAALPGSVGRLAPGTQARVDDGAGHSLLPGKTGELGFRAAWMCTGYAGNPEATRAHFRDGWFYPGDIGCIEADGSITLRGRMGDVINYGGLKIWPEDIEALIKRHPDVADAAVVGLPEPMAGEVPVAFVVLRRPLALPALRGFCAAQVEPARIPQAFVKMDAIPRNFNGKVMRERLAEAYVFTPEGVKPRA